jgi:hypothetical protein
MVGDGSDNAKKVGQEGDTPEAVKHCDGEDCQDHFFQLRKHPYLNRRHHKLK